MVFYISSRTKFAGCHLIGTKSRYQQLNSNNRKNSLILSNTETETMMELLNNDDLNYRNRDYELLNNAPYNMVMDLKI